MRLPGRSRHLLRPGAILMSAQTAPFTCEYCKRAPAAALLVFDMVIQGNSQRIKNLVCADCGTRSNEDLCRSSLAKTAYLLPLPEARRVK